jgi:hypothetical protein
LFRNADLEQVVFPMHLLLPQEDKTATDLSDVLVFMEAPFHNWLKLHPLLSQLKHKKDFKVDDVPAFEGEEGFLDEESGVGEGVNREGVERELLNAGQSKICNGDEASQDF